MSFHCYFSQIYSYVLPDLSHKLCENRHILLVHPVQNFISSRKKCMLNYEFKFVNVAYENIHWLF